VLSKTGLVSTSLCKSISDTLLDHYNTSVEKNMEYIKPEPGRQEVKDGMYS
jgi:hypothetical protein